MSEIKQLQKQVEALKSQLSFHYKHSASIVDALVRAVLSKHKAIMEKKNAEKNTTSI